MFARLKTPRKKMRLEGYDYSCNGAYFVTVCTFGRAPLFYHAPVLEMVSRYWETIPSKFPAVGLDEYIIMPNHIHGILFLNVGSDQCVGPSLRQGTKDFSIITDPSLPKILQWFKTLTTNAYLRGVKTENWPGFAGKLWQHSYHERILRKRDDVEGFREYIRTNPDNWAEDPEYVRSGNT